MNDKILLSYWIKQEPSYHRHFLTPTNLFKQNFRAAILELTGNNYILYIWKMEELYWDNLSIKDKDIFNAADNILIEKGFIPLSQEQSDKYKMLL
jgi:hypothetical protein